MKGTEEERHKDRKQEKYTGEKKGNQSESWGWGAVIEKGTRMRLCNSGRQKREEEGWALTELYLFGV